MAAAAIIAVGTATAALPGTAGARWHGGWPGHGGWGWGRFGWGFAAGFAIGFNTPFTAGVGDLYYAYGGDCAAAG
ncbi:MAG TPA: sulfur globule protein precursor [Pseudolabrys sp.]|nr:sulfur globule protein precursor [Pseudolabrys sp.]